MEGVSSSFHTLLSKEAGNWITWNEDFCMFAKRVYGSVADTIVHGTEPTWVLKERLRIASAALAGAAVTPMDERMARYEESKGKLTGAILEALSRDARAIMREKEAFVVAEATNDTISIWRLLREEFLVILGTSKAAGLLEQRLNREFVNMRMASGETRISYNRRYDSLLFYPS